MDAASIAILAFLSAIVLLVWLLMRSARKEREHPRHWWQKKKRLRKESPFSGPIGSGNESNVPLPGRDYSPGGQLGPL